MSTRLLMLIPVALVLPGCVNYAHFQATRGENLCGGNGYAQTFVAYGDSRIVVKPVVTLRRGAEFRIKLIPVPATDDPFEVRDLKVTIVGKGADDKWIEKRSGSFDSSSGGFLPHICVPADQELGTYEYLVTVENVGQLDPRARVD